MTLFDTEWSTQGGHDSSPNALENRGKICWRVLNGMLIAVPYGEHGYGAPPPWPPDAEMLGIATSVIIKVTCECKKEKPAASDPTPPSSWGGPWGRWTPVTYTWKDVDEECRYCGMQYEFDYYDPFTASPCFPSKPYDYRVNNRFGFDEEVFGVPMGVKLAEEINKGRQNAMLQLHCHRATSSPNVPVCNPEIAV